MAIFWLRDGGTWKFPTPWLRDAGTWKPVVARWIWREGIWIESATLVFPDSVTVIGQNLTTPTEGPREYGAYAALTFPTPHDILQVRGEWHHSIAGSAYYSVGVTSITVGAGVTSANLFGVGFSLDPQQSGSIKLATLEVVDLTSTPGPYTPVSFFNPNLIT